jgi:hypothetical protein
MVKQHFLREFFFLRFCFSFAQTYLRAAAATVFFRSRQALSSLAGFEGEGGSSLSDADVTVGSVAVAAVSPSLTSCKASTEWASLTPPLGFFSASAIFTQRAPSGSNTEIGQGCKGKER